MGNFNLSLLVPIQNLMSSFESSSQPQAMSNGTNNTNMSSLNTTHNHSYFVNNTQNATQSTAGTGANSSFLDTPRNNQEVVIFFSVALVLGLSFYGYKKGYFHKISQWFKNKPDDKKPDIEQDYKEVNPNASDEENQIKPEFPIKRHTPQKEPIYYLAHSQSDNVLKQAVKALEDFDTYNSYKSGALTKFVPYAQHSASENCTDAAQQAKKTKILLLLTLEDRPSRQIQLFYQRCQRENPNADICMFFFSTIGQQNSLTDASFNKYKFVNAAFTHGANYQVRFLDDIDGVIRKAINKFEN